MRPAIKFINKHFGPSVELYGAEVGVRSGKNSVSILQSTNCKHLLLVDHWKAYTESSGLQITQAQQDEYYSQMLANIEPYFKRVEVINMYSVDAANTIKTGVLDFVYIDAHHGYDSVKADINAWWSKVRPGGIICGHDFNNQCTPQVCKAVFDFFKPRNIAITPLYPDWLVIKNGETI